MLFLFKATQSDCRKSVKNNENNTLPGDQLIFRWLCACKCTTQKVGRGWQWDKQRESENTYCGTFYPLCRCLQLPLAMPPLLTCQPHFQHSDFQAPVSEEAFGHSWLSESHCEGVQGDVCDSYFSRTYDGSPDIFWCAALVWSRGAPAVCPLMSWLRQGHRGRKAEGEKCTFTLRQLLHQGCHSSSELACLDWSVLMHVINWQSARGCLCFPENRRAHYGWDYCTIMQNSEYQQDRSLLLN